MKGLAPLHPLEFQALLDLDAALHDTSEEEPTKENNGILKKPKRPWPQRED